ncbi:MAG: NF038122 family metalloprotease [Caulobacteraceae bacterium]
MKINVVFDSSASGAPAGFVQAVDAAAGFWDATITNPISITIDFGYGEIAGQSIGPGALAESESYGYYFTYSQVRAALAASAISPSDHTSLVGLPLSDPTAGGQFFVTTAEANALSLAPGNVPDGYVGLSSAVPFTFDPANRAVAGKFDAVGALEHEISEVLGRIGDLGMDQFQGSNVYDPIDLFRYSSPGARNLTPGPGSFSIDGQHLLQAFNDPANGGDAADWNPAVLGDSFGDGAPGVAGLVSPVDLAEMDTLGYDIAGTPLAVLTGLERSYSIVASAGSVVVSGGPEGAAHTLTGLKTLQFADGTLSYDPSGAAAEVYRLWDAAVQRPPRVRRAQIEIQALEDKGSTLSAIADQVAASPAFVRATAGMNHSQLVGYMYQTALRRAPSASEAAGWTAYLDAGHSAGELLLAFSESPEHVGLTAASVAAGLWAVDPAYESVEFMYQVAFGHAPDAAGLANWAQQLKSGLSLAALAQGLTTTAEFQAEIAGLSHGQIVDLAYQNALHQPPDSAGAAYWTSFLDGGGNVSTLIASLEQNPRFQRFDASSIDPGVAVELSGTGASTVRFSQAMAGLTALPAASPPPPSAAGHVFPPALAEPLAALPGNGRPSLRIS